MTMTLYPKFKIMLFFYYYDTFSYTNRCSVQVSITIPFQVHFSVPIFLAVNDPDPVRDEFSTKAKIEVQFLDKEPNLVMDIVK